MSSDESGATATSGGFDRRRFAILWAAGMAGVVAILPSQLGQLPADLPLLPVLASALAVNGLLVGVAVGVGVALHRRVGFAVRRERGRPSYRTAVGLGLAAGTFLVALDVAVFGPLVRDAVLDASPALPTAAPLARRAPAVLYGGVTEELLLRFGLLTLLVWAGWKLRGAPAESPSDGVVWGAILVASLLFGLGHLPATALAFELTPAVVVRGLALNAVGGVVFGWLYWRRDLLAAVAAHLAADVVLVLVVPALA